MIKIFKHAEELPDGWDKAAGCNAAMGQENLGLLEQVNPCQQEYVIFGEDEAYAILVKYILKIDIFCFSKLHLYLPINIIGIPCSVAEPGYHFTGSNRTGVLEYLSGLKGAKLILNAGEDLDFLGFAKGYTLPSCTLDINWNSFGEYLLDIRSHYRYRYKKALKKMESLSVGVLEGEFDSRLYHLYEQVYDKSKYKLEKLSINYFRQAQATVVVFKRDNEPLAFVQYAIQDGKMVFLFGGLEYHLNKTFDLYQNMLLYLVRVAIENNCTTLSLGQTAEEMKCRLGARQEKKYMYIHHESKVINWLVKRLSRLFSYKITDYKYEVFRKKE